MVITGDSAKQLLLSGYYIPDCLPKALHTWYNIVSEVVLYHQYFGDWETRVVSLSNFSNIIQLDNAIDPNVNSVTADPTLFCEESIIQDNTLLQCLLLNY